MATEERSVADAVDRLSGLPELIIDRILSFLPARDLHKASVLSKTFLSFVTSFPVIVFNFNGHPNEGIQQYDRTEAFIDALSRRIRRTELPESGLQIFELVFPDYVGYEEAERGIDEAITFAIAKGVEELNLWLGSCCYPLPSVAGSGFHSIKILNLRELKLDNLHHLIASCPYIESLYISLCLGFRNFTMSSASIRSIALIQCHGLASVTIESPSLKKFIFDGEWSCADTSCCEINISSCTCLEILHVLSVEITDEWVGETIPQLIQLQQLKFDICPKLQSLRISNQRLKKVEFMRCSDLLQSIEVEGENVESINFDGSQACDIKFDTPNLISFISYCSEVATDHWGYTDPATVSISTYSHLDDKYFVTLRDFIDNVFGRDSSLTILCNSEKDLVIPLKTRGKIVFPLRTLKRLEISGLQDISVDLVDSLLWLFPLVHYINFVSDDMKSWIDVVETTDPTTIKKNQRKRTMFNRKGKTELYKDGIFMPDDLTSCCSDEPEQCWRHTNKVIQLENFDRSKSANLKKYFSHKGKLVDIDPMDTNA